MEPPTQRTRLAVLTIGGTGTTGSRLHRALEADGHHSRAVGRSTEPAFQWTDVRTHDRALDGMQAVYLLPPVGVPDPEPLMVPFIERAVDRGVRRLVLLSSSAIPEGTPGVGRVHAAIKDAAPEWAVLRPSWFMQNFERRGSYLADDLVGRGALSTSTGDGRVAFVDAADIAAVALRALVDPESHQADHVITGPQALSYDEVADIFSRVLGRRVVHERVTADAVRQRMERSGIPPAFAAILAGLEDGLRNGAEDRTTDTVQRVTGRPARTFEDWVRARADAWG